MLPRLIVALTAGLRKWSPFPLTHQLRVLSGNKKGLALCQSLHCTTEDSLLVGIPGDSTGAEADGKLWSSAGGSWSFIPLAVLINMQQLIGTRGGGSGPLVTELIFERVLIDVHISLGGYFWSLGSG